MQDTGGRSPQASPTAAAAGVTFDAAAESVAQARHLVVRQLHQWALDALTDDARLVVSELLTNAALHAKPPIRLHLARLPGGVRVEISDGSSEMPLMMRAGEDVMTGRGWTLIDALCAEWGVEATSGGKLIWAILLGESGELAAPATGNGADQVVDSSTFAAKLPALNDGPAPQSSAPRYTVALGDVPTDLLLAAKAHIDAVIREFALMSGAALAGAAAGDPRPVPAELNRLIERVVGNFAEARQSIKKQALRAARAQRERTQLLLNLPVEAADAGLAYLAALDEVDAYCRAERMLTLETLPAHRVFRRWYVEQLVAGLRHAAADDGSSWRAEPFEIRLIREYDSISAAYAQLRRQLADGGSR